MIKKLYKDFNKKAVTFSFDDGASEDTRLLFLFNKYGFKATFNISSLKCNNPSFAITDGNSSYWENSDEVRQFFSNHEIATHSLTHFKPSDADEETCDREIREDIKNLEEIAGYKIRGYAAPFGDCPDKFLNALKKYGIAYNRTVSSTFDFSLPEDFLKWSPTAHFSFCADSQKKHLTDDFLNTDKELALFYIWGHSFEMSRLACNRERWCDEKHRLQVVENEIFKKLSGIDGICYATNIEICDYISALRNAEITDNCIKNPTETELFFEIDGKNVSVKPKSEVKF